MNQVTRALGACVAVLLLRAVPLDRSSSRIPRSLRPAPTFGREGDRVGVPGARYSTSVTQNANIVTIREAIGTRDISPDVAQGLRARGIDAEARVGVERPCSGGARSFFAASYSRPAVRGGTPVEARTGRTWRSLP